jgi:hypothetical protein
MSFTVTCPLDGGRLESLQTGKPSVWSTRSTARCVECGTELILAIQVFEKKPTLKQTGGVHVDRASADADLALCPVRDVVGDVAARPSWSRVR